MTFRSSLAIILQVFPMRRSWRSPGKSNGCWWSPTVISATLIFPQGFAHAGILFFRLPGATLQTKIEHLDTVCAEHAEELARGAFLVVAPGQIRVAGPPRT